MTSANTGAMLYQLSYEATTAMIILHFDLQPQFKYMNYFIYTSHHFTPHGRYELNKLTSLPMCGFIAQLVEHRTGIRGGHNLRSGVPIFFRGGKERLIQLLDYSSAAPKLKYLSARMSATPSLDKNEPTTITGNRFVGGNYTRHEQPEFTWFIL